MSAVEQWQVIGEIEGEPFEFVWTPEQWRDDLEGHARRFVATVGRDRSHTLQIRKRVITTGEWEQA